jgi:transposase-like protein
VVEARRAYPVVTVTGPSCPLCTGTAEVERLPRPIGDRQFWCGDCNLTFAGTDEEWRKFGPRRLRRAQLALAAIPTEETA